MNDLKCRICGDNFTDLDDLLYHYETEHKDMIPKDYTPARYYYYLKTDRDHGTCPICHKDTEWNEEARRYNRFCPNPKCHDKYVEIFRQRMIGKYGKITLLKDPAQQKKMLANRKISGTYIWSDGSEKTYTGTYEKDFLQFLDIFMNMDSKDVETPSPHIYYYEYEGETKFYFPDVFVYPWVAEFEIKDGGDNPNMHGKIQAVDKEKEKLKDQVLMSQKEFNYIKITNKIYDPVFEFLNLYKQRFISNKEYTTPIFVVHEAVSMPAREMPHIIGNKVALMNSYSSFDEIKKGMLDLADKVKFQEDIDFLINDAKNMKSYVDTIAKTEKSRKDECMIFKNWITNDFTNILKNKKVAPLKEGFPRQC